MFSSIQSIPGLIFARSDVKAKIRPGVEATDLPALSKIETSRFLSQNSFFFFYHAT